MNQYGLDTPTLLADEKFSCYDSFAEGVAGWDLDFKQLSAGAAPYAIRQLATANSVIGRFSLGAAFEQRGASIPGMQTFAFIDASAAPVTLGGSPLNEHSIGIFPQNDEFRAINQSAYCGYTLSFSDSLLEDCSSLLGISNPSHSKNRCASIAIPEIDSALLRLKLQEFMQNANTAPDHVDWEKEICLHLLNATRAEQSVPRAKPHGRAKIAGRAVAYVDAYLTTPITVPQLANACNTSIRTLEYAMKDQFGLTPKRYIVNRKLVAVKNTLQANPELGVADAAHAFGFSHMGQFAASYRKLLGELPSTTRKG